MDTTGQAGSSARIHGAPNGPPMKCARKVQGGFAVGCSRKLRLRPSRLARANHIVRRTTKLLFGKRKTGRDENHTSERNILVGDFRGAAGRSATSTVRIVCRRGVAFEVIAPTSAGTSTSAGPRPGRAFGAATQHAEVAGDNLKAGALLAFLVLPFAGLDAAFDEDQRTLLKILLSNFSLFAPHDDLVPLGPLLALAVFVFVRLIRGNGEICDGLAAAGVAGFGIAAQTADENDFIDGHERIPPSGSEDNMRGRKREIERRQKSNRANDSGQDRKANRID